VEIGGEGARWSSGGDVDSFSQVRGTHLGGLEELGDLAGLLVLARLEKRYLDLAHQAIAVG